MTRLTLSFIAACLLSSVLACAPTNSDPAQTRTAKQVLEHKETFVLDVRTGVEFSTGHLDGATNIPVSALEDRLDELPEDRTTPVLVYCRSGGRSAKAKALLESKGYTSVTDGGALESLENEHE